MSSELRGIASPCGWLKPDAALRGDDHAEPGSGCGHIAEGFDQPAVPVHADVVAGKEISVGAPMRPRDAVAAAFEVGFGHDDLSVAEAHGFKGFRV